MWTCSHCNRTFRNTNQQHSCKIVPLELHFKNKEKAKELFDCLVQKTEKDIGKCRIVSLPCCFHLFGSYDFLAALPKKDGVEIRFALDRKLNTPRMKISVLMSSKIVKNCFDIHSKQEFDEEFMGWVKESYFLNTAH